MADFITPGVVPELLQTLDDVRALPAHSGPDVLDLLKNGTFSNQIYTAVARRARRENWSADVTDALLERLIAKRNKCLDRGLEAWIRDEL